MDAPRDDVPTHPLIEHAFGYARLPWRDNPDAYWEEMPKLMQVICEVCSGEPSSASNVYYYLRDHAEVTALDHVSNKGHKIVVLSRLMTVMAGYGILVQSERSAPGGRAYAVFSTATPFAAEGE